ncbi:monovalent cation/H+ antiporter complex subunit F [Desulfurivibrio alkaliphilus]|uniref:Multiple resistance and pH regulation protein F n=1 Tax=Desulfurivibrio alkaliphilus (strain DSM 19089 / UNIQEM U267 / AHT2) TaxID=589865 RepID=D6Z739_DESAT|nr:monovalent cation/H+ antiporter complex subunit F [Desulfurivibrio alkaliphilus]ADH87026.1 multiple resistance and pH regulation protein F [Desulfurivibrio alkaliphilus AHT 2]
MNDEILLLACTLFLLLTICLGLIRVVKGPTAADRMLTAQLFGTTGVGIFLLLAEVFTHPTLRHIALVYALLAAVAVITFVRRYRGAEVAATDQPGAKGVMEPAPNQADNEV